MLDTILQWLRRDFGPKRTTIIANKMETVTYRAGRFDLTLLVDPQRQTEFEKEYDAVQQIYNEGVESRRALFDKATATAEGEYRAAVRELARTRDMTKRALAIKYSTVKIEEPLLLREATMSRSLGARAEA